MRLVSPRLAPLAGLLLLLAAVGARAAEIAVDWEQCFLTGVSGGVCPPVDVAVGDTVTFNWAGFHNVVIMPSEADYGECAPGAGEVLAPDAPGGAFPYTVPEGAAGGALYFVCTVPGHCSSGQKITLNVGPGEEAAVAAPSCTTVADLLVSANLTTLATAVDAAAAASEEFAAALTPLLGEGPADPPLMVFAPTDAAFEALFVALNTTGEALLNSSLPLVTDVLKYHVSPDMLDEAALEQITTLLPGETLLADEQMVEAACSNATVSVGPVETCSGMAYVIDRVLLPSSAGCA